MPNRVLREGILTSELVSMLSWAAEVFYRRLHSVVDDFGRYHAHPSLLRAACYPLQLNKVADSDVVKWLAETRKAGLVRVYTVEGKQYLQVLKFDQRVRAEKSKFPQMTDEGPPTDGQLSVTRQTAAPGGVDGDEGGGGAARKRASPCPTAFNVTEEMSHWAASLGLSSDRVIPETEKFLDHYRSNGKAMKDWDASWRNWIRKAIEFGARG